MSHFSAARVRKKEFRKGVGQSHPDVEREFSLMDFFENRMPGIGQSQLNVELKRTRRKGESEEGVTAALCLVFQKGKDIIRSWVITAAGTVRDSRSWFWTLDSRALTGTEPWGGEGVPTVTTPPSILATALRASRF